MEAIPVKPSEPWYDLTVPLTDNERGTITYIFEFRWNVRDESWYFNMFEADHTPIIHGVRVVLGMYLGRRSQHPFFAKNALIALNTSRDRRWYGVEAGLDDFGVRVQLIHVTDHDIIVGRGIVPANLSASAQQTDG